MHPLDAVLRDIQLRILICIFISGCAQAFADSPLQSAFEIHSNVSEAGENAMTGGTMMTCRDTGLRSNRVSDLEIIKKVDREFVRINEQVVYTLTITNHGPDSAHGIQVIDNLPFGLTFIEAIPAQSGGVDPLTWILDLPPLPPDNAAHIQIRTKTTAHSGGMDNNALVSDDNFDPDLTNNTGAAQIHNFVPVELSVFRAVPGNGCIVIEWETQSETENLGFYLYRAESAEGPFIQLNERMIKGAGSTQSAQKYFFTDVTLYCDKIYHYQLDDVDFRGMASMHGPVSASVSLPMHYKLKQNFPNPFNSETRIEFQLEKDGFCELSIYNISGQLVRRLVAGHKNAGLYRIQWDGLDEDGNAVPCGMYLYQLCINGRSDNKKMCFVN